MAARIFVEFLMLASAFATPNSNNVEALSKRSSSYRTGPGFIPAGQDLKPQLDQHTTNGNSVLGTADAPTLPDYLPNPSSRLHRSARRSVPPTDMGIGDVPVTGVVRPYTFTITEQDIAPDGVTRPGMVVNGGYPGPTIEANWGDWFEITVINQLPNEGTSMHWHGLLQHDTPYYDGVPGTQQCPIAPGGNLTYKFRADVYGTSFYHSHYSAQYTGGIYGAMIIYGPHDNAKYDVDLGPVIVNDWYHVSYYDTLELVMAPIADGLPPPTSNNCLINGKMNYPCANATGLQCTPNAGISKFNFRTGKKYRLRLINAGAEGIQKFSIDGHNLTVIANDFVPLVPYTTDVVTLSVGQRTDVVVEATGEATDAVWMRSTLGLSALASPLGCTLNDGVSPEAVAAIYYQKADQNSVPTTNSTVPQSQIQRCTNDPLDDTIPYYPLAPAADPTTVTIDVTSHSNGTTNLFWMNNSSFRADYNAPVLLAAKNGVTDFAPELNVYSTGNDTNYRIILYNYATAGAHPMHMHGHNYHVLAQGYGTWNGHITHHRNPQRRDVQLLPSPILNSDREVVSPSYIVLEIETNNPGAWPLHCHIAWHVSLGLYVTILEQPDALKDLRIPSRLAQTCRDWDKWTHRDVPDQIDSGL